MASRREMLLAAQRKREKRAGEYQKEETLVDVYANSTEKSIIVNNDTSSKMKLILQKLRRMTVKMQKILQKTALNMIKIKI